MATPGRNRVRFQEAPESARKDRSFELQEDPSFWKDNSVQVVIRVRPLNGSEISTHGQAECVRQDSCQSITWTGNPETRFTFDHVADKDVTQEKLFKVAGVPMVDNCVDGYNSCMFAYGQTGSGKTYTMLGDIEGGTRRHSIHAGMTPRVFEYLFSRIQKEKEARRDEKLRFTCKCSFLEIYNEQILDLLDPSSVNLQIREDIRRGVYVENLTEFEVSSARDIIQHLVQGSTNRKVASTNMNRASSRSHSVFTCVIESKWEVQGVTHHRFAHLHLVDLAGSERQKSSGAEGERLKEATNINKSLSTLGLVIMNLVAYGNKKALHIPYRDSKLTFLLQDSLGGNSKTIIIANISPSNCSSLETLSTLKFAQRAKHIRNNAIVNEDASGDVLAMRSEIQQLKKELYRLKGLNNVGLVNQGLDNSNEPFLGSPEIFKWDDGHGSFSPLTLDKRLSQGKESQAVLFASLKREQDKDKIINALLAEKQTAEKMVSQRAEEVQALKMRLRLREDQIKRLEAGATGALPSDASLLQERDELLKEIEILRNQLERNPQITRFAMEALQLKEKLRRVQSLVGEGQQEKLTAMSEEITVLRDKLLEALEWKMMHEKDAAIVQDLSTSRDSSVEENEFLRMQAIHYEKNLLVCLESKEKLQRRVDELVSQVEELNAMKVVNVAGEAEETAATNSVCSDNQMELRTLVEAISAASQREAEAHETAITLANENGELQAKLRASIEDKNEMTKYYESIVGESSKCAHRDGSLFVPNIPFICAGRENTRVDDDHEAITRKLEHLEIQLADMHEENDKLMGLYEQAMQERDEFKRFLHCSDQKDLKKVDINCSVDIPDAANTERSYFILGSTLRGLDELTNRIEVVKDLIHLKQSEVAEIKVLGSQIQEKKLVNEKKLLASRFTCALFSNEKLQYWQARQKCAQAKVAACVKFIEDKKEEMEVLKSSKREVDIALLTSRELEAKSKDKIKCIRQKIEEAESRQKEVENVLFTIENFEKEDVPTQRNCNLGKASELLKTQEEKAKLVAEMKLQEKMTVLKKDVLWNEKKSQSLDIKVRNLESEIASASASLEKGKSVLQKATLEIETLNQMTKDVKENTENLLVDHQEILFQLELKEAESNLLAEELQQEKVHLKQLKYEQRMLM